MNVNDQCLSPLSHFFYMDELEPKNKQSQQSSKSFSSSTSAPTPSFTGWGSPDPILGLAPMSLYGSPGVAGTPEGGHLSPQRDWPPKQCTSPSIPPPTTSAFTIPSDPIPGVSAALSPHGVENVNIFHHDRSSTVPAMGGVSYQMPQVTSYNVSYSKASYSTSLPQNQQMGLSSHHEALDSWGFQQSSSFSNVTNCNMDVDNLSISSNNSNIFLENPQSQHKTMNNSLNKSSTFIPNEEKSSFTPLKPVNTFVSQDSAMLVNDFNTQHSLVLLDSTVYPIEMESPQAMPASLHQEQQCVNKGVFDTPLSQLPENILPRTSLQTSKKMSTTDPSVITSIDIWAPEPDECTSGSFSEWSAEINPLPLDSNIDPSPNILTPSTQSVSQAIQIPCSNSSSRYQCQESDQQHMTRRRSISRSPLGGLYEGGSICSPLSPEVLSSPTSPKQKGGKSKQRRSRKLSSSRASSSSGNVKNTPEKYSSSQRNVLNEEKWWAGQERGASQEDEGGRAAPQEEEEVIRSQNSVANMEETPPSSACADQDNTLNKNVILSPSSCLRSPDCTTVNPSPTSPIEQDRIFLPSGESLMTYQFVEVFENTRDFCVIRELCSKY